MLWTKFSWAYCQYLFPLPLSYVYFPRCYIFCMHFVPFKITLAQRHEDWRGSNMLPISIKHQSPKGSRERRNSKMEVFHWSVEGSLGNLGEKDSTSFNQPKCCVVFVLQSRGVSQSNWNWGRFHWNMDKWWFFFFWRHDSVFVFSESF